MPSKWEVHFNLKPKIHFILHFHLPKTREEGYKVSVFDLLQTPHLRFLEVPEVLLAHVNWFHAQVVLQVFRQLTNLSHKPTPLYLYRF